MRESNGGGGDGGVDLSHIAWNVGMMCEWFLNALRSRRLPYGRVRHTRSFHIIIYDTFSVNKLFIVAKV